MPLRALSLLLLLALPPVACAEELGETEFVETCRDGGTASSDTRLDCDTDRSADGMCVFGQGSAAPIRVPRGSTVRSKTMQGAVGEFSCLSLSDPEPSREQPVYVDEAANLTKDMVCDPKQMALAHKAGVRCRQYGNSPEEWHRMFNDMTGYGRQPLGRQGQEPMPKLLR